MFEFNNYMSLNPMQRNLLGYQNPSAPWQSFGTPNSLGLMVNSTPKAETGTPWYKNKAILGGAMAGGATFISQTAQNYAMGQVYGAAADSYRSQARLALDNIETQNAYLNEQGAQQVWNLADQKAQFKSEQMVAWATSGFSDISTGDRRIIADTDRKYNSAAAGIRRNMFLQNFENWRSGMMEYSRLQYAAKSAERLSKASTSVFSYMGAASNAIMSGMGAYWSLGGGQTNNVGKNITPKGKIG